MNHSDTCVNPDLWALHRWFGEKPWLIAGLVHML